MPQFGQRSYCSSTTIFVGNGLTLADTLLAVLDSIKALSGVFRQDPFLVLDFAHDKPLGLKSGTAGNNVTAKIVEDALAAAVTESPETGSLLVYAAAAEYLQQTIALTRPTVIFIVTPVGSDFAVSAQMDSEFCPDQSFLSYALDLVERSCNHPATAVVREVAALSSVEETEPDYFIARLQKITQARPERIAVRHAKGELSYADIWSLSNRLAAELVRRGGRKTDRMMIIASRSPEVVICVLAALKTGIAFSILDAKFARGYIRQCAEIISPAFLLDLSGRGGHDLAPESCFLQPSIEQISKLPEDCDFIRDVLGHNDTAVITFTSGTSGGPKAVAGRYGSLTHFFDYMDDRFGPFDRFRFGMCSSIAHDPLQRDILTPLYCAGSISIPAEDDITSLGRLQAWLAASSVNVICVTSPLLAFFSGDGPTLSDLAIVIFVGASLRRSHVSKLHQIAPNARIINTYGATESQRAVSFFEVPLAPEQLERLPQTLSIGKGMKDVDLVVWNHAIGRRCFPYEMGEIAIRSHNIALGYINAPEFSYRFQTQLLGPDDHTPVYMTGDLGYYCLDGCAMFVCRTDSQHKIHGHRVDLDQISDACRRASGVKDAYTLLVGHDESQRLVTFIVPTEPYLCFDATGFRAFLAEWLPYYMIPTEIQTLHVVPLTNNGKVDARRLQEVASRRPELAHGPVVAFAADFISAHLGRQVTDLQASLADLGLDSIHLLDLMAAVGARFNVSMDGLTVNNSLSISALAAMVERRLTGIGVVHADKPKESAPALHLGPASAPTSVSIGFAGKTLLHFCSNSYLGLAEHSELRERLAVFAHSNASLASHGSMLVNGYTEWHESLENELRALYGCEAVVLYGSGYIANLSVIPGLVGPGDQIFLDERSHQSLREGCSMSGARVTNYAHNDPADLEKRLQAAAPQGRRLVVSEAVFGLDGDIADLPALSKLSKFYQAVLVMDEASSLGQLGRLGGGIEEQFQMTGAIDIRTGTLAKAIPSIGGFAACTGEIARQLRSRRGSAFSTAISPIQAFLAAEALRILKRDGCALVARLQNNGGQWRNGLRALGLPIGSATAVARITCQNEKAVLSLFSRLFERGIYALPLTRTWTAASFGIRTSVTASHAPEQIAWVLDQVGQILTKANAIEAC
jgi:7-keto-8-aminopelargonate synthetase-like enzyme/non-ribosomal peptide synthetase component F/acyl carrier protein